MIKKREVNKEIASLDHFINGSDQSTALEQNLNPRAPRKFKTHTIPMNEYEYNLLTELAEKYGQTHNGIIRFALKKLKES